MKGLAAILLLLCALTASAQTPPLPVPRLALPGPTPPTNAIGFTWSPVPWEATGYRLYWSELPNRRYTNFANVGLTTNVLLTNFKWSTTYYFAATAIDQFGADSLFSNEIPYTTPAPPAPRLGIAVDRLRLEWPALAGGLYALQSSSNNAWTTHALFQSQTNTTARFLVTNEAPHQLWRVIVQ
jgi:hypothetical protein